jgi:hypothetical protein
MTRKPARVTLSIDRITTDRPGLDRTALEAALRDEVRRLIAGPEAAALHLGSSRAELRTDLPPVKGTLSSRVATATINAVKTNPDGRRVGARQPVRR